MRVFRLSRRKYADVLSGTGAARFGNRWNSKGTEIIYTSESRALAMAEVAVHLSLATIPSDFVMLQIEIPDEILIGQINPDDLANNWNSNPPVVSTQKIGDKFIHERQFGVLKVPSAVVKGDFNYLINPFHSDFHAIQISSSEEFLFDQRLLK